MLAGKGYDNVYNLSGGFKGWQGEAAFGSEETGLTLFTGDESPEKTLIVAYSLEDGLRDFYLSMILRVKNDDVKNIFKKLAEIEISHQDRVFDEYVKITGKTADRAEFEKTTIKAVAEGGLTTQEYIELFQPADWESESDIIGLAMSVEAQALDLYMRAAEMSSNPQSKKVLTQIADEERTHLAELGKLMERI
jgi:rubrerythrin